MLMHPIVFVHGLGPSYKAYEWSSLQEYADKKLAHIIIYKREKGLLHKERALYLADMLATGFEDYEKVHLFGHSAGGTDIRMALFLRPELKERVVSVTTMGTPHRGTPVADMVLQKCCNLKNVLLGAIADHLDKEEFVREMTPKYMHKFNEVTKNEDHSNYYCMPHYVNKRKISKLSKPNFKALYDMGYLYNDDTVPTTSQVYGNIIYNPKTGWFLEGSHAAEITGIYPFGKYGYFPWSQVWKRNIDILINNCMEVENEHNLFKR